MIFVRGILACLSALGALAAVVGVAALVVLEDSSAVALTTGGLLVCGLASLASMLIPRR